MNDFQLLINSLIDNHYLYYHLQMIIGVCAGDKVGVS
jgi:hypothetical protein